MNGDDRRGAASSSIRSWPCDERPREILFEKGVDHVSNAGLLAIILQNGFHGKDAVTLARELLARCKGLNGLFRENPATLMKVKGLGRAKIARILASIELARRSMTEEIIGEEYVDSASDILKLVRYCMRDCRVEQVRAIFLNKRGHVLAHRVFCEGSIDSATVYPREVIKAALELDASGIVFLHNHPSGSRKVSEEDLETAQKLSIACRSVGIEPIDHLIFCNNEIIKIL